MKVALRVDASPAIGSGHVMRCLTLAERLRARGARTVFFSRGMPQALSSRILGAGHALVELGTDAPGAGASRPGPGAAHGAHPAHAHWLGVPWERDLEQVVAAIGHEVPVNWMVVDHYGIDARWERGVRAVASRVLAIDDLADRGHDCDLLLDQNLAAEPDRRYRELVPAGARCLLGPRHALLRDEFAAARRQVVPRGGPVRRLLVGFGGFDAANLTAIALDALERIAPPVEVDVVIGAGHPDREGIERTCGAHRRWHLHVETGEMARLMAAADLAVGACGAATWERAALGLPCLAFAVADNQRAVLMAAARAALICAPLTEVVVRAGAGPRLAAELVQRHLQALIENAPLREHISRTALATVDAGGAERVVSAMLATAVGIRPATAEDARTMLEWRNAPRVRRFARDPAAIDAESHRRWLSEALANPRRELLIGVLEGTPLGVLRYDLDRHEAEVSIYLEPGREGRGLGAALLAAGERWLAARHPEVEWLVAEVIEENAASLRLFAGAGYARSSSRYRKRIRP
ncbi:MAG: UDP-2,4-diacetamido-2,4,6-trideoxy-beta-L-altropyranose hydrolase [Burkholderiales bacterium]|nr:MAG: UDP-2,4-diacetamido-2,4,6-trideoxy-beta-L-altropyranose hydrolase [Burkholderiales bacterium]